MKNYLAAAVFGTTLLLSGCTVHHYHHQVPSKHKEGATCPHSSAKGHGAKGHGMPEGHPPVSGHEALPEGHPPVHGHGMKGHHGAMSGQHGEGGQSHGDMPQAVTAFHDSFAEVWHEEVASVRSTAACAKTREWSKLAVGVRAHKAQREQAVDYSNAAVSLAEEVQAVEDACRKKTGSVQPQLETAHGALHAVMKAASK